MGYAGISNMLAVEFDTFYNPDLVEPYENHVSIQTRSVHEMDRDSVDFVVYGDTNAEHATQEYSAALVPFSNQFSQTLKKQLARWMRTPLSTTVQREDDAGSSVYRV